MPSAARIVGPTTIRDDAEVLCSRDLDGRAAPRILGAFDMPTRGGLVSPTPSPRIDRNDTMRIRGPLGMPRSSPISGKREMNLYFCRAGSRPRIAAMINNSTTAFFPDRRP